MSRKRIFFGDLSHIASPQTANATKAVRAKVPTDATKLRAMIVQVDTLDNHVRGSRIECFRQTSTNGTIITETADSTLLSSSKDWLLRIKPRAWL